MGRRVTSPKRVTSPTWGPPPPCKQALSLKFTYYNWSYDSHNCKKTMINIDVLFILVSLSCDTERQISFLGYSHFIEVNYLWIPFVITFISCMIKFSHLINIAMEL